MTSSRTSEHDRTKSASGGTGRRRHASRRSTGSLPICSCCVVALVIAVGTCSGCFSDVAPGPLRRDADRVPAARRRRLRFLKRHMSDLPYGRRPRDRRADHRRLALGAGLLSGVDRVIVSEGPTGLAIKSKGRQIFQLWHRLRRRPTGCRRSIDRVQAYLSSQVSGNICGASPPASSRRRSAMSARSCSSSSPQSISRHRRKQYRRRSRRALLPHGPGGGEAQRVAGARKPHACAAGSLVSSSTWSRSGS